MLDHPVPASLRRPLADSLGVSPDDLPAMHDLIRAIDRRVVSSGEPPLSLRICQHLDVSALGALGLVARASDTLRDALHALKTFHERMAPFLRLDMCALPAGGARITLAYDLPDRPARRTIHEAGLGMLVGLGRGFTQVHWAPTEACMPSGSSGRDHWEGWLGCPIRDSSAWSLVIPSAVLDLPLIHADPVVRGVLVPSLPPPTASPGIVRRLAAVLDAAEAPSAVPAPSAARSLGLSERSLNRRLEEAGTSVRALRAEAVRRRAEALLSQGMAVGEVAQALGFATTSSFSRAWRRWTGTSPTRRKAER